MEPAPKPELDALLAHASWARRLARSLVADVHRAEDLVQRAWVAALEAPPRDETPVRRWIAAVMRNFARADARDESRRRTRERWVARAEATDANDGGPVARSLAGQEALVRAVRALHEPYRTAIWSRYFEGLPPREIARRTGAPVKTVKTQLARGLVQLRAQLDRERDGDRTAWVVALLPLVVRREWKRAALGALMMNAKLKLVGSIAAAALLAGAWFTWNGISGAPGALPAPEPVTIVAASEHLPEPSVASLEATAQSRETAVRTESVRDSAPALTAVTPAVAGRVVDLAGRGIADLEIVARGEDDDVLARSDTRGRFEIESGASDAVLLVHSDRWTTVYGANRSRPGASGEETIIVAPRRPLAGVVLDGDRNPIAGADVAYDLDESVQRDAGAVLHRVVEIVRAARSDERGRFELADAPLVAASLIARAEPWPEASVVAPETPTYDLEIVLKARAPDKLALRGRVVDRERRGVAEAWVSLAKLAARTGEDGAFELEIDLDAMRSEHEGEQLELRAARAGHLPARVSLTLDELSAEPARTYELVLGDAPLSIAGRVVDADGKPVAGAEIDLSETERFGELPWKVGAEMISIPASFEQVQRGGIFAPSIVTDATGAFTFDGLLPRAYRFEVIAKERFESLRSELIEAGTRDVVLKLPAANERVRVAGRIVSRQGEALADVEVHAYVHDLASGIEIEGPRATSSADGAFDLGLLPRARLQFLLYGGSVVRGASLEHGPDGKLDELVLVAPRECRVQIELDAQRDLADRFAIFDGAGERLTLGGLRGSIGENMSSQVAWAAHELGIHDGKSDVAAVAEEARTLVLYKGDAEVGRRTLDLKVGELNVLRP